MVCMLVLWLSLWSIAGVVVCVAVGVVIVVVVCILARFQPLGGSESRV